MIRRCVCTLALTIALGGALSACGGGATDPDVPATSEPSGTPSSPGVVDTPTAPAELSFGDAETVAWAPTRALDGELSIRVDGVREGRTADFKGISAAGITEDNQPYYVDVVITNEGEAEFGGLDVPLYLVDSGQTLSPPSKFANPFEPCPSGPLPSPFGAGDEVEMCLVFFSSVGATFQSVTFQPGPDPGVVWTGDVSPANKPAKKSRRGPKRR